MRFVLALLLALCFVQPVAGGLVDDEFKACIQHLQEKVDERDWSYIKFFTTYNVPEELQQDTVLALSFWVHSLTGVTDDGSGNTGYYAPIAKVAPMAEPIDKDAKPDEKTEVKLVPQFVPLKLVEGSKTLWWIDIRDYNWTEEAFEKVSLADPYLRQPWVTEDHYNQLRLMSGNALIRADWFIAHTSDTTKQFDLDEEPLYYILLYAHQTPPKNASEYRKIWGIDLARIEKLGLAEGSIVNESDSIVSRHTRELSGVRTDTGYHWESSDFKNTNTDVLEELAIERNSSGRPFHPKMGRKADAHEYITSNLLGLQVYFLADGKENRVEFGDPSIVVDTKNSTGDFRVRQVRSCVVCHAVGINPTKNALREALGEGVDLISTSKDFQQAIQSYYLTDIGKKEVDDQLIYSRAISAVNGLEPAENARVYQNVTDWYDKKVTLEQAARECGVTVDEFKNLVGASSSVRLNWLCNGTPVPRGLWDNRQDGLFAQSMLLIHRLPALNKEELTRTFVIVKYDTQVKLGKTVVAEVNAGDKLKFIETHKSGDWHKVKVSDEEYGYIYHQDVVKEEEAYND